MTDTSYNGWRNYETWATALWLGEADYWPRIAEIREEYGLSRESADILEEMVAEVFGLHELSQTGLLADLLNAAWQQVDWREILEHADS